MILLREKNNSKDIVLLLLITIGILLRILAPYYPQWVENLYSMGIYKIIGQVLSNITGAFPFSLGEIIMILLIPFIVWTLINLIITMIKHPSNFKYTIYAFLKNYTIAIGILYFLFISLWGLNYYRLPFSVVSGLETKPASKKELKDLCLYLITMTNELRSRVSEDERGIMIIDENYRDIFKRASLGYEKASAFFPQFKGIYGVPKGVFFSRALCFSGISGIYFPFTSEANVNIDIPLFMIPATVSHEMAHQRGYAREDEANYIAYLTSSMHPDIDFQYSGHLLALIHSMNAIYRYDKNLYTSLKEKYDDGVSRDLAYLSSFWNSFEGPIDKAQTRINNAYLKANNQKEGVYSYGRMVDLLIAEHKKRLISSKFFTPISINVSKEF